MATKVINCRFCQIVTPTNGKRCLGCGMPVANARIQGKPKRIRIGDCPACGCRQAQVLDNHRKMCRKCGTEFELPDFDFLDSRPEHNAIKKGL